MAGLRKRRERARVFSSSLPLRFSLFASQEVLRVYDAFPFEDTHITILSVGTGP